MAKMGRSVSAIRFAHRSAKSHWPRIRMTRRLGRRADWASCLHNSNCALSRNKKDPARRGTTHSRRVLTSSPPFTTLFATSSYCGDFESRMRARQTQLVLCAVLAAIAIAALLAPCVSARPSSSEVENMAEALRYLEQIDKYYSQMARPR